jgi:hypothetical protein
MARSSTFPLVDRILDGRLGDLLTDWRAEGATFQDIAYQGLDRHCPAVGRVRYLYLPGA